MSIDKIIKILEAKNTELNLAVETYTKTNELLRKEKDSLLMLEKLKTLIIDIGQKSQLNVLSYIEETVTMALNLVFGEEYKFKIQMNTKRDQSEVNFFIAKGDLLLEPRNQLSGGGITDVVAFVMQVIIWSLEKPQTLPVLIMDEPQFKNISKSHLPKVAEMVKKLSEMMRLQIIMVSHINEMIAVGDNIIEI